MVVKLVARFPAARRGRACSGEDGVRAREGAVRQIDFQRSRADENARLLCVCLHQALQASCFQVLHGRLERACAVVADRHFQGQHLVRSANEEVGVWFDDSRNR